MDDPDPVFLWADADVPGLAGSTGPEVVTANANGERSVKDVHFPSIVPFFPAEGTYSPAAALPAVLVIPGGGHSALAYDTEGTFVARWLAARGVAAFVLKHRLGRPGDTDTEGPDNTPYVLHRPATHPDVTGHCILDTERAIRLMRSRAVEWGVDPTRGNHRSNTDTAHSLVSAAGLLFLRDCLRLQWVEWASARGASVSAGRPCARGFQTIPAPIPSSARALARTSRA